MSTTSQPAAPAAATSLAPGIVAAAAFACADVLGKIVFIAGGDVLTLLSFRSVVGLVLFAAWLRVGERPAPFTPRERWVASGLGLLFAVTVYCIFEAINRMDVPTAILAYFVYPLITGLVAGVTGLERLGWRGVAAAIVAFLGLALMIGAHPGELAFIGVAFSFAGAISRAAMLLFSRALLAKSDARLTSWYSLLSSTVVFVVISAATRTWHPPHTGVGWAALAAISVVTIIAILATFISTSRVGPFRTALVMNLEPLITALGSALLLGEVITPVQGVGAAIMLAALVAFQLRR
ncbi:MAG TPA: DMT family transporter [Xanthobacteraceae bacterium]